MLKIPIFRYEATALRFIVDVLLTINQNIEVLPNTSFNLSEF